MSTWTTSLWGCWVGCLRLARWWVLFGRSLAVSHTGRGFCLRPSIGLAGISPHSVLHVQTQRRWSGAFLRAGHQFHEPPSGTLTHSTCFPSRLCRSIPAGIRSAPDVSARCVLCLMSTSGDDTDSGARGPTKGAIRQRARPSIDSIPSLPPVSLATPCPLPHAPQDGYPVYCRLITSPSPPQP